MPSHHDDDDTYVSRLEVEGDELVIYPTPDGSPVVIDLDRSQPKPIKSPGNALEAHLKGYNWAASSFGHEHMQWLYREELKPDFYTKDQRMALEAITIATLNQNSTTFVSSDMMSVALGLAETPYGEDYLHLMDIPDEGGVILFEHSIPDGFVMRGDPMREMVRIIGYGYKVIGPNGTQITDVEGRPVLFQSAVGDSDDPLDPTTMLRNNGGLVLVPLYDAGTYLVGKGMWESMNKPPFLPMNLRGVPFGPMPTYTADYDGSRYSRVFLTALFRLMWQRILPRDPWTPKRHERRQFDRLRKHALDGETYKVVHVRRYEGHKRYDDRGTQESDGLWSRQAVVVRGHVREQWYPTLGPAYLEDGTRNPFSHRRIWIDAHVRGDGIPVLKHNVTAVVR